MRREDFYTGEPVNDGSPLISENEAIENAGFAKYDFDPGTRAIQQPVSINPGGYGYNPNPVLQQGYNPYQMGNQYYNQQAYFQQQAQMQQMQNQEVRYFIEPVNFGGSEYLPPTGYEDLIERLKLEYWMKIQETSINNNTMNYGNNYYGMPYFNNPYQYSAINSEISKKIDEIKNEAKQNRINLNIQLSKLAHNILGDNYDEEAIKERYTGKYVSTPSTITYADIYDEQRLNNLVPFDNSQLYRDHSAKVTREFNSIIPANSNLQDTFKNHGILGAEYELENERHRRRDNSVLYDSENGAYKYFVKAKAAERSGKPFANLIKNDSFEMQKSALNQFPTLSQTAKLCDDGTLNITCNFGSHAGQTYSVHNSQEAGYEKEREKFNEFLNTIPGSIYLDNNPNKGV